MEDLSEDLIVDDIESASNTSDDQVQITPAEVIELMEEAWVNEKFAPEILPHRSEIVDIILDQITTMEENIQKLSSTDFTKSVYQLEVDRLRFLISSYLRTRLEKIEAYVIHILNEESKRVDKGDELYLSEQELKFAKDYSHTMKQYFEKLIKCYPGNQSDAWSDKIIEPNLNSFVFLKSKNRVEGISIEENNPESDLVDFNSGSQMIISYSSISELVKKGEVHLI
ncbi:DNA replication complex GINS protein SLD5 [Diabrotica undecimpunctata]|uniref:DNA replication complex GINS protein SLD5 n=1 Tax=Diabrotica undecimpunctata TaxID=50387 RepID=UPI003B634101